MKLNFLKGEMKSSGGLIVSYEGQHSLEGQNFYVDGGTWQDSVCEVQLKKKKWSGPEECFTCGKLESSDHILFQCPTAVFLCPFLRVCLGWESSPYL